MRLAKEGLLEPRETFQRKHSNTYFKGTKGFYSNAGVADDHLPFLQKSKNLFWLTDAVSVIILSMADEVTFSSCDCQLDISNK